jgi:hypothetical protein
VSYFRHIDLCRLGLRAFNCKMQSAVRFPP